jgi:thiol-disulfide isomerase/thioredoxin
VVNILIIYSLKIFIQKIKFRHYLLSELKSYYYGLSKDVKMKKLILKFSFLICPFLLISQTEIFIHQVCQQKVIGVINHPEIVGVMVDKETLKFLIPRYNEPTRISFNIDTAGYRAERVWVDSVTSKIDLWIYNCGSYKSKVDNPNLLTKDERINNIYFDYLAQKYPNDEDYVKYFDNFLIEYITNNPKSFLSIVYATKLTNIRDNKFGEILKNLEPSNSFYPTYQKAKNKLMYKKSLMIGESIDDLKAKKLDGSNFFLSDVKSKVTILMFWQSTCSWSRKLIPKISEIQKKFTKEQLSVIYFSLDENKVLWQEASNSYNIPDINISDLEGVFGKTSLKFGISATPYFLILNKEKKLRTVTFGNEIILVENELSKILAEK